MENRIFNFSAGPAVLPEPVLEEARNNLLSLGDTGIGILEHSHRGPAFRAILAQTEADCRELAGIPDNYRVLFLQGGASTQFFQTPMNFLTSQDTADFLVTGSWSKKAAKQAERYGGVHVACDSADRNYCYIPAEVEYSRSPKYVHYTSNNTIFGTQFSSPPASPAAAWLICDASSDIFSRPIDVTRHALIYAGAQKNLGPAGVTLVVIRDDLVKAGALDIPEMLQYRTHAENDSSYNTPPTFAIYVMGLVFQWLLREGGLEEIERRNRAKAEKLYAAIDESPVFRATADVTSRSLMNVTFVTGNAELDQKFVAFAEERGLSGLKGHRSVGGMRASIYNAFPEAGVDALIAAMRDFERTCE
ncbi:MAG: 3-phosphoserine/phosphohydroxythreonine transaminase [Planctomycetota bacterium]|nr:MAG: 3-phosphoserine/phosphohydroxythreonine transaminase [Planctomycetota bacterium]REJ96075.1 MAG: 3-phosphoserine/phosphohydroxythreonine transaminase [Planctomycetota bacterium]REK29026.1 MAG: 3-phosphoserine/phosphohydroxythreonine transaminase [Planctomycetota bacterium]REK39544.1 MAG: 3-phosphoserine/phosphohydroxythreonine transaminase [Planctomycetota bacterium]